MKSAHSANRASSSGLPINALAAADALLLADGTSSLTGALQQGSSDKPRLSQQDASAASVWQDCRGACKARFPATAGKGGRGRVRFPTTEGTAEVEHLEDVAGCDRRETDPGEQQTCQPCFLPRQR